MKVIAINGSPRPKGNTYAALKAVCDELNKQGIETEIIQIGNMEIKGCIGCGRCKDHHCIFSGNELHSIFDRVHEADGLLLGSPVYYSGIAGTMKCFLDRLFYSAQGSLRLKVGASVVAVRRSGGVATFDQLNHYFLISEMLLAPSYYWNVIHGTAPGDVAQDQEGMSVMRNLANNMAWMLKMQASTRSTLPLPEPFPREYTNFVR
jgi:multimeric flavodoxin WrbA